MNSEIAFIALGTAKDVSFLMTKPLGRLAG